MRKNFPIAGARRVALFAGVGLVALAVTSPAFAQDAADATTDCVDADADGQCDPAAGADGSDASEGIVVTGSRIRRPNIDSNVPITSLTGEQFFSQGDTNVGETLNDLPQLRSTFAQSNPGLGIGVTGLNLLDLRGLGVVRTLVLVNGRRHVAGDVQLNAGGAAVDINTIPSDLIERVDIVTGGNSAIYGSDAIAGVVNFVLRRDFEGIQVRGQVGIAEEGFGGNQYVSAMAGQNFADGRGNITLHGEYFRQDRIVASDIPAYRTNDTLAVVDVDSGGLPNNSDGFPDRVFIRDIRQTTISPYGLIPIPQPTDNSATPADESLCGRGTLGNNGPTNNAGLPFNCTFIFTPEGRLVAQTGTRFGTGQFGSIIGGNGTTGREADTAGILPELERYNINLLARFEVTPEAELFAEAKYTRIEGFGRNAGPSFIQGQRTQFDERERLRLDNPYLNPSDRATLVNAILTSGFQPRLSARTALSAADRLAVANGTLRFDIARNFLDAGIRDEFFDRTTYRIVGGVRGTFNEDWSYEISGNYGRFEEDVRIGGAFDRQRFVLAMDAGVDPNNAAAGIQCRAKFDSAAAVAFDGGAFGNGARQSAAMRARLAADIAACVPYNPFGAGNSNAASVNYFTRDVFNEGWIEQYVASAFVSGDSSQVFELPGGPVRFALGGEYRIQDQFTDYDDYAQEGLSNLPAAQPNTNAVSAIAFDPNDLTVKEVFGELQLPLLSEVPFFHELTVLGAARYSSYNNSTGDVWAYNVGVDWAPIQDLKLRANYGRAVRAPNLAETGRPTVANFANGFRDPCEPGVINTTANRARNCLADLGAPLLATLTDVAASLPIFSGSNPNLRAETSDSYTVGGVFQPRFVPGLALSVDYYHITVNDIITPITAQTIVNSCYDSATLDNIFCDLFQRNRTGGPGPVFGENPGRLLGNSLTQQPLNYAKRVREGIDVNLNYRARFGDVGISTGLIYTHNFTVSDFQDPTQPDFEDRILGELGDPEDEFRFDLDLMFGQFTFGYQMRFIGEQFFNLYEDYNGINAGLTGATPPGGANADFSEPEKYPIVTYHNFRFEWNLSEDEQGDDLRFYVGVDNAFNRLPPLGSTATGAFSAIYDYRGRSYYAGIRAKL